MRKILFGGIFSLVALAFVVVPTFASQGQNLNPSSCDKSGAPVINVNWKVINDPDSGFHGNWATDNYNKHLQVWQSEDGSYCGVVKYEGKFVTTGPNSPQDGLPLGAGIKGTFEGGYYTLPFTGTLQKDVQVKGNLGTFDMTKNPLDWVSYYFGTSADSTFNYTYWSWTYHAGNNGTWINAWDGSSGDITGY